MLLAVFKALFAIGGAVLIALAAIMLGIFFWEEWKKAEEHDNMGK